MTKLFKLSLLLIVSAEMLSFLSFQYPVMAPWIFSLVALAVLAATVKNLEWGICLVFAELVIGSFGKILVLPVHGWQLPIRMVLFGIVMAVWIVRLFLPDVFKSHTTPYPLLKEEGTLKKIAFFHSQFFKPYLILAVVLVWGLAWGIIRGNDFGAVFFDVNNYFYFTLIFPAYEVLSKNRDAINRVLAVITAAVAWLSIKTIALFYIFSHEFFGLQDILYAWSRRMQLAEITNISPVFLTSRIFMQSQIWVLFGLFVGLGVLFPLLTKEGVRGRSWRQEIVLLLILLTTLIMSFSRSFWLAVIISLAILIAILLFGLRERLSYVLKFSVFNIGVIILAIGLSLGVMVFPLPRGKVSNVGALKERIEKFSTEPAASSRFAQIRPLLTAIAKHPALGSGFGTSVTYQSQDPRIVKSHPDGWYTTTAFELGWLEMWLKIGLLGMGAYLYLLWMIFKAGWKKAKDNYLILGGLMGLIALIITHGLSPYLNHPLGIGIILLTTSFIDNDA